MNDLGTYLKELENLLEESWTLPIAKNKYIVDGERLENIINQIRKSYPIEIAQAKEILAKKDQIEQRAIKDSEEMRQKAAKYSEETLLKARRNRDNILSEAEAAAKAKLDDQEIIAAAQRQAAAIIQKAKDDTKKMRAVTLSYVKKALDDSERSLLKATEIVEQLKSVYGNDDSAR